MGERPKRRKYKDNPYTLNYSEEKNIYTISFKDGKGILRIVEVNRDVYTAMDRFELDDLSEMNEYDNHIEHSEVFENTLHNKVMNKPEELEDYIIRKSSFEDLMKALNQLTDVQRRRIKMYYFDELKLEEIAKIEKTSFQIISKSIKQGITNLKKILKK